jgi:hypothetical protein
MNKFSKFYFDMTPELFVQFLTTGNEMHGRITEGLPPGTEVVGVELRPHLSCGSECVEGNAWLRFYIVNDKVPLKEGAQHIVVETIPCPPSTKT